ncbi:MAG: hybrid sensor histidine kinase/response regulator [Capsulimonas sp.]|nr:hybrid sensor histidine kinase/response regulator [Capsulimonas sp.]
MASNAEMNEIEEVREELARLRRDYGALVDNAPDVLARFDRQGRFLYINKTGERNTGIPAAAFLGKTFREIGGLPEINIVQWEEALSLVLETRRAACLEYIYPLAGGVTGFFECVLTPDLDEAGEVASIVTVTRDFTARHEAQVRMRESEERYRTLVDATAQIVWTNDAEGRMVGRNDDWSAFTGQTDEEYQGFGWAQAVHPDDAQPTVDAWMKSVAARAPFIFEHRLKRRDGVYRTFSIRAVPVLEPDGSIREWVGIHVDITERKAAEQDLRARAEREALISKIARGVLWSADPAALRANVLAVLGGYLHADRCFYVLYDIDRGAARVQRDWALDGVPSLEGEWDLKAQGVNIQNVFHEGRTLVVDDIAVADAPAAMTSAFLSSGQRSFIAAPFFYEGRLAAALAVMMADTPRHWTPEETSLVEAAAVQVRGAVEAARARDRELEAQRRQRDFLRDVLASVTEGRLILCQSDDELPPPLSPRSCVISLSMQGGLRELRHEVQAACSEMGMCEERCFDLVTAASEAGMNTVVHVGKGEGQVMTDETARLVQVRLWDHGPGIALENLPKATLRKGYSSAGTLGHGMKMMLQTADRVYLRTSGNGTVVVIEQHRDPPAGML